MSDTLRDLRAKAKAAGIKGYSRMQREALEAALSQVFPVSSYGDCDVRNLPGAFVHITGKRIQPTCKRLGIECVRALTGFTKVSSHYYPVHDGVVVRAEDADRLRMALEERAARNTPEARAKRQAARERAHERDLQKVATKIRERFPCMPAGVEMRIARHAWEVGSGRVGRSRRADDPIRAAVIAHIRHEYTEYDCLRAEYGGYDVARECARDEVRSEIDRILFEWEGIAADGKEEV